MASSSGPENELEEELKDAGNKLLMPPSSIDELLTLLDKLEDLLSKVEQAPSRSMQDALQAATEALIAIELLRHSDMDVKVSVVSCITELTRISAPDPPYSDEQMKEIFQLTIMALENLSHLSGRCYLKAVQILEYTAQVRSCLVMQDLGCDALIVEMFKLFLKTLRPDHPQAVFWDMEAIMTLVIEESDMMTVELLNALLSSVKKDNQNIESLSWKLGVKVLENCATILRSYLPKVVKMFSLELDDYAEVIAKICQNENPEELMCGQWEALIAMAPCERGHGYLDNMVNVHHRQRNQGEEKERNIERVVLKFPSKQD
ncbi:hypothetical protein RJ639_047167 [Escallonia herrerae]|uniref:Uncharacterized protein n=1 Tax=Escallonia herrerae TaxID=1293975 RepID=A0AA89B1N8_9ASTE|nr:hypothetical protein RJ639_047167 [Escallonia herrerae]